MCVCKDCFISLDDGFAGPSAQLVGLEVFLGGHTGILAAEASLLAGQTAAASLCRRQQLQLLWAGRRCLHDESLRPWLLSQGEQPKK